MNSIDYSDCFVDLCKFLLKVFDNAGQGVIGKIVLIILMNVSYFLMSLTLREVAVGVAYATWEIVGGIGVLLVLFAVFIVFCIKFIIIYLAMI